MIGNSAPARKNGRIATAGVAPMYSSCLDTRAASVSATPYMNTVNSSAAAANHASPLGSMWKLPPRAAVSPISTIT